MGRRLLSRFGGVDRRAGGGGVVRRKTLLLGTVVALLAMALPGSALAAKPGPGTCSGGSIGTGTWTGFTVTGKCTIADGATVQINGNLIVANGAILNDHAASKGEVDITGNILVGKGAILGLGYNAPAGTLGPDTVGGSIVAIKPLTLYLGNLTVAGNVISIGGASPMPPAAAARNFPIKDNTIIGNLIILGWQGGWLGVIRNDVEGNVIVSKNVSLSTPPGPAGSGELGGPGMDPDSTEVMTNTISGNLICLGNTPAAQVNPTDKGQPNIVGGKAIGECSGLTR
jgi:hypothetical protein